MPSTVEFLIVSKCSVQEFEAVKVFFNCENNVNVVIITDGLLEWLAQDTLSFYVGCIKTVGYRAGQRRTLDVCKD